MFKLSDHVTDEQLEIARLNGISRSTLYQRIKHRKMNTQDAITKPLNKLRNELDNLSKSAYSCRLPQDIENKFNDYINQKNLTISDGLARCVIEFFNNKQ